MPLDVPRNWLYVDTDDLHEARYWAIKWDVTVEELRRAVALVGHSPSDVERELLGRVGIQPVRLLR